MSQNHAQIVDTLTQILDSYGLKYSPYEDKPGCTKYPLIDGMSIKFWNIFPHSGPKIDLALLECNNYLRPLGYFIVMHIWDQQVSLPADERYTITRSTFSLLVKLLPDFVHPTRSPDFV